MFCLYSSLGSLRMVRAGGALGQVVGRRFFSHYEIWQRLSYVHNIALKNMFTTCLELFSLACEKSCACV